MPVTHWPVTPYLKQCGPPAFVATLPPICEDSAAPGSGGKHRPFSRASRCTVAVVTPASTSMRHWSGSSARTLRRRSSPSTIPEPRGTAPPAQPVPPPRGTIGTPFSQHHATTAATSSASPGRTTASATPRTALNAVWSVV